MPRKSNGRRGNFQLLMVNDPDGGLSPGRCMALYIRIGGRNAYAPSLVPENFATTHAYVSSSGKSDVFLEKSIVTKCKLYAVSGDPQDLIDV